jgi:hypothetical protein
MGRFGSVRNTRHYRPAEGVKGPNASRQGAKPQRTTKGSTFRFFAPLRETVCPLLRFLDGFAALGSSRFVIGPE